MSKTILIVIGIACAVISAAPILAYDVTNAKESVSAEIFTLGFDVIPSYGFGVDPLIILGVLTIVLLLAIVFDAMTTRRKSNLNDKIQQARDEIKTGTHIANADNSDTLLIRFVRLISLASLIIFISIMAFHFIRNLFWIHIKFVYIFVLSGILLLPFAAYSIISAQKQAKRPIIIKKSGETGIPRWILIAMVVIATLLSVGMIVETSGLLLIEIWEYGIGLFTGVDYIIDTILNIVLLSIALFSSAVIFHVKPIKIVRVFAIILLAAFGLRLVADSMLGFTIVDMFKRAMTGPLAFIIVYLTLVPFTVTLLTYIVQFQKQSALPAQTVVVPPPEPARNPKKEVALKVYETITLILIILMFILGLWLLSYIDSSYDCVNPSSSFLDLVK